MTSPSGATDHLTTLDIIDHLIDERLDLEPSRHRGARLRSHSTRPVALRRRWAAPGARPGRLGDALAASSSTRPRPAPRRTSDGRSVWIEPTSPHMTSERDPRRGGATSSPGRMDAQDARTPSRRHRRRRGSRRAAGRRRRERSPATIDSCSSSARPAPARPRRCAPPSTICRRLTAGGVRRRTVGQGRPCPRTRDRGAVRHARQAAPRVGTSDRPPLAEYRLPAGTTVLVDEAGMVGTSSLASDSSRSPTEHDWRLVLIGDHHQLQAVGRGGMFHELCGTGRAHELDRIHRFDRTMGSRRVPATATRRPPGLDAYIAHDRVVAAPSTNTSLFVVDHGSTSTRRWQSARSPRRRNDHVDAVNAAVQISATRGRPTLDDGRAAESADRSTRTSATSS